MSTRWLTLVVAGFALGFASCDSGPDLQRVTGTLTVGGKPAQGATVVFHPKGNEALSAIRPSAMVGADGTYSLMSGDRQGAPPGEYVVTIAWREVAPPGKGAETPGKLADPEKTPTVDKLQGKYSNRATSQISRQVVKGKDTLDAIELP